MWRGNSLVIVDEVAGVKRSREASCWEKLVCVAY